MCTWLRSSFGETVDTSCGGWDLNTVTSSLIGNQSRNRRQKARYKCKIGLRKWVCFERSSLMIADDTSNIRIQSSRSASVDHLIDAPGGCEDVVS
jgi:hypothetical protein